MEALVSVFIPLISIPFGIGGLTHLLSLSLIRILVLGYALGGGLVGDVVVVVAVKGRMTG